MIGFGTQAFAVALLYAAFAFWTLAAWLIVRRIRIASFMAPSVFASTAIVAPIAMAQVLTLVFWVAPGADPAFCIATVFVLPALVATLQARPLIAGARVGYGLLRASTTGPAVCAIASAVALGVVLAPLVFQLFFLPLHGNDPLEYMQLGRVFAENRDARLYPILTALPESGFIAPWTHPPTYGVLISFAFMLQGSSMLAGAAKTIGLWFALSLSFLSAALVYSADRRASWRVWIAPAFVLSVPVFFELVQSAHIDALRVAAFTAAVALGCSLLALPSAGAATLAGVGLACAMLTHSIGILAPAIVIPLVIVCWTGPIPQLMRVVGVIVGVALMLGAPYYLRNIAIFGNPIQDNVPLWDIAALKVKEFVRVSRGLETLLDRLYLGALMPWTRSELFGLLPTALVLVSPFALVRSIARQETSFVSVVAGRSSSLPTQLATVILGFLSIVFLSVLAGSELAVKNARYILTIVPIVVVTTLIAAGVFIEDSRITAMARRVGRPIINLVPKRLTPSQLPPLPLLQGLPFEQPKTLAARMAGLADLAAVFLIGCLALWQYQMCYRAAVANVRVYLDGSGSLVRLTDTERMKRRGSSLGDAQIEAYALANVPPDEKILLFRQASYGFYASRRFVFHLDGVVEDLFRLGDAPALHRALFERGFRWILTPDFSLPEINNSAFSALLGDPSFVRPAHSSLGWTLYAIRGSGEAAPARVLARVLPASIAGGPVFATTEQGPGMVDGRQAVVRVDSAGGFVELSRQRGAIKHLGRWDTLLSRPLRTGINPHDMSAADWYFESSNPVAIRARISGKGFAEVAVEYTVHSPLMDVGATPAGLDDMDVRSTLARETLWSGVLEEQPMTVGGWIVSPLSRQSNATDRLRRGARILFRLRDGDWLRVHDWVASEVVFPEQEDQRARVDAVLSGGWSFASSNLTAQRGIELRLPAGSVVERSGSWPFPPVGIERPTTRRTSILTPSFWQPDGSPAEVERERALQDVFLAAASLRLEISGTLAGFGRILPQALVYCSGQARPSEGIVQSLLGREGRQDALPHVVSLPPIQLWGDVPRRLFWSEPLPCVPYRVRLMLISEQQPLVVIEEFLKDPDRARSGFVDVHGMQMTLVGGVSSLTRRVLPLQLREPQSQ